MAGGLSVSDANEVIDIIVSTLEVYMHPLSMYMLMTSHNRTTQKEEGLAG